MPKTVRVIISGRVQGVGYRAWTVVTAFGFGLKGWVRNVSDGTVEAVFHGEETQVDVMLELCKEGPAAARVEKMEMFTWNEAVDNGPFQAKPTA
jgi:acylphosphatase